MFIQITFTESRCQHNQVFAGQFRIWYPCSLFWKQFNGWIHWGTRTPNLESPLDLITLMAKIPFPVLLDWVAVSFHSQIVPSPNLEATIIHVFTLIISYPICFQIELEAENRSGRFEKYSPPFYFEADWIQCRTSSGYHTFRFDYMNVHWFNHIVIKNRHCHSSDLTNEAILDFKFYLTINSIIKSLHHHWWFQCPSDILYSTNGCMPS